MKPPLKQGMSDDYQTPPEALTPLLPYLKNDWTIWEPAEGSGNLSKALYEYGFDVVASELYLNERDGIIGDALLPINEQGKFLYHYKNKDFLSWEPNKFNCIITNPPFKFKQQFLQRCYELGRPFALLLPLTTFETAKRQELFKKYGLEVIFFDKRINFETPNKIKNSSSWFATAWFTNGLNIGQELTFVKLG